MTDYHSKQRRVNMVVGLFVVFAIVVFMWMLLKFRELPLFVSQLKSFNVLVYFPETPGVQKDTPVQYCGYQIGRVMNVSHPEFHGDTHRIKVTIAIDKKYVDIPEEADIVVMKRGLGSSYIEVRLDPAKITDPNAFLKENSKIETGTVGMASDFFPPETQEKLEHLVDSISSLTENANAIIGDGENQTNIKKMITSIETAFSQAEETLKSIQKFSEAGTDEVQVLGDKIEGATEQLEGVLSETRQLLDKIGSGEGSAGKLINDGRLYEDLVESSQELRLLLEQIKEWAAEAREDGLRIKL